MHANPVFHTYAFKFPLLLPAASIADFYDHIMNIANFP